MIEPTVGRIVWFYPGPSDPGADYGRPMAAIIVHVWSNTCVNLAVFDRNGNRFSCTSVLLWQGVGKRPEGQAYCEWMPYQKGQAAKAAEPLTAVVPMPRHSHAYPGAHHEVAQPKPGDA